MALKYLNPIDLSQNEIQNVSLQNLGSDPSTPVTGQVYFNTTNGVKRMRVFNGTSWDQMGVGNVTSVDMTSGNANLAVSGGPITGSGTFTVSIASGSELAALTTLGSTGLVVRTGPGTFVTRTIVGGTGISVADGGGTLGGNPTISTVQDIATTASPTFAQVSLTNTPTNASHAATKSYVDGLVNGLKWKQSVKAATTSAGTLSTSFAAGQTIDGVTLAAGDRILVKNQAAPAENGIYIVASSGAPTRAMDADAWTEFVSCTVPVEQGTANGDTIWYCTSDQGGTLGTTAINFSEMPAPTQVLAGLGLVQNGNALDVSVDNSSIEINADSLRVKALGITNAMLAGNIDLTTKVTGQLPIANGGTGASTQQAAINALTGTQSSAKYLRSDGTNATLSSLQAADMTGTLAVGNGGTGLSSYSTGDLLYASGSTTLAKLTAAASGNVLISGTTPSWGKVGLTTHVTGTLPVANGGTGATDAAGARANLGATTKFSANFGDGTTKSFTIAHGLGTADLSVHFYEVSTGKTVMIDYTATSTNITFTLPVAPTASQYRVVAIG